MGHQGTLIIVSGPSGAGKTAMVEGMVRMLPGLLFSISHTTRAPRIGEVQGVHYFFVGTEEFHDLVAAGAFLEWAQVYGNYYGTSKKIIEETLAQGKDVILDVDVQGAHAIHVTRGDDVSVFVMPPSYRILRERLEKRALDKEYVIEQRLTIALEEIQHYRNYDYLIVNDHMGASMEELRCIILASRCRIKSRAEVARVIIGTFGGVNAKNS